jgi:hypothetical protein
VFGSKIVNDDDKQQAKTLIQQLLEATANDSAVDPDDLAQDKRRRRAWAGDRRATVGSMAKRFPSAGPIRQGLETEPRDASRFNRVASGDLMMPTAGCTS